MKDNKPCTAKDLYISPLFKKAYKWALQYKIPIYILSAKYGLIKDDQYIAPYEKTLNNMSKDEINSWGESTAKSISQLIGDGDLLVLAGEKYLTFTKYCQNKIINPLKGLGIGKRLQWFDKHTKKHD
jgi:cytoplasmic iron level regulating protein YaaA (DUF328/UPF0246 family)